MKRDVELARDLAALGHPTRLRVMRAALDGRRPVRTSLDASRALGLPLTRVAYHVRILRDAGLLTVVGTVQRRGALQAQYAPSARAETLLAALDRRRAS